MFKKLIVMAALMPGLVLAKQVVSVNESKSTSINIAKDDLSRIYVAGDRIAEYWTANNNLDIKTDENKGELYIIPKEGEAVANNSLYLITEKGKRLNVVLTPKLKQSQTIELQAEKETNKTGELDVASETYELKIVNLMKAMYNDEQPGGYGVNKKRQVIKSPKGIKVTQVKEFNNGVWAGKFLEVKNKKKEKILFSKEIISTSNTIAVGYLKDELRPKETITVFGFYVE